ncbi:hypothetical protein NQZ68_000736 [Dissostichus eleginoides]|nr:hypothetical protein NQZ68_000736 [Dissostichus eleginoides]
MSLQRPTARRHSPLRCQNVVSSKQTTTAGLKEMDFTKQEMNLRVARCNPGVKVRL